MEFISKYIITFFIKIEFVTLQTVLNR